VSTSFKPVVDRRMYYGKSVNYRHLKKEMLFWTETPEDVIATISRFLTRLQMPGCWEAILAYS
jgi:hypothetical protein